MATLISKYSFIFMYFTLSSLMVFSMVEECTYFDPSICLRSRTKINSVLPTVHRSSSNLSKTALWYESEAPIIYIQLIMVHLGRYVLLGSHEGHLDLHKTPIQNQFVYLLLLRTYFLLSQHSDIYKKLII